MFLLENHVEIDSRCELIKIVYKLLYFSVSHEDI